MPDILGNYGGNTALAAMIPDPCWLSLHTDAPDVTGSPDNELAGAGYIRQKARFAAPSGRVRVLATMARFHGLPGATVTHIGAWSAISAGSFIWAKLLSPSILVPDSGFFIVEIGDLAIGLP